MALKHDRAGDLCGSKPFSALAPLEPKGQGQGFFFPP